MLGAILQHVVELGRRHIDTVRELIGAEVHVQRHHTDALRRGQFRRHTGRTVCHYFDGHLNAPIAVEAANCLPRVEGYPLEGTACLPPAPGKNGDFLQSAIVWPPTFWP